MLNPTYKIRSIRSKRTFGATAPSACSIDGILKFDGPESPHCVYNEQVCCRLAQTLHIPVADGVLTTGTDGPAFVSLEVSSPGERLPDIHYRSLPKIAAKYQSEVAAVVAFDIFIGNSDRYRNMKVSLVNDQLRLFRAFDHSHALLNIDLDAVEKSVAILESDALIAEHHPFYGLVDSIALRSWCQRIADVQDVMISECCVYQKPFRGVPAWVQDRLAAALNGRKRRLLSIIQANETIVRTRHSAFL